jgi:hypothetical protein
MPLPAHWQMYDSSLQPRITEIEATPDMSLITEYGSSDNLVTAMNEAVTYNAVGIGFVSAGKANQSYAEQMSAEDAQLGCFLPAYPSSATQEAVTPLLRELYPVRHKLRSGWDDMAQKRSGSYASRCEHMLQMAPDGPRWRRHILGKHLDPFVL